MVLVMHRRCRRKPMPSCAARPCQASNFYFWVWCGFGVHFASVQFWATTRTFRNSSKPTPNPRRAHTKTTPRHTACAHETHTKPRPSPDGTQTEPRLNRQQTNTKPTSSPHQTQTAADSMRTPKPTLNQHQTHKCWAGCAAHEAMGPPALLPL